MLLNRVRDRNLLFAKRWFSDDVILVSVGWYLRSKLSYRDLAQIPGQMGVAVARAFPQLDFSRGPAGAGRAACPEKL
jgi:hypothetical protein